MWGLESVLWFLSGIATVLAVFGWARGSVYKYEVGVLGRRIEFVQAERIAFENALRRAKDRLDRISEIADDDDEEDE